MTRLASLAFLLVLLFCAKARGEPERPWAKGVGEAEQAAALRLFDAGNTLFTESQYAAALARYRDALRLWSHPAIRYNAAVSLINLDQPLAAYEQLEAALAYGEAPLGAENHRQALLYMKLLSGQLAELEVTASERDAEVTLDGELLLRAPGRAKRRLLPGAHQLVAKKPGFLSETRALQLPPGKLTEEVITLSPIKRPAMRSVRRWAVWKPWAVIGAGAAVGLAGVPLMIDAKSNFDTFDAEVARLCPSGCTTDELPSTVTGARDRGRVENDVAIGLFVAGGATIATGIVLLILNQPRLEPEEQSNKPLSVTPVVGVDSAGISATMRY